MADQVVHEGMARGGALPGAASSLHASYDTTLNHDQKDSIFRLTEANRSIDSTVSDLDGESSKGRKHVRQHTLSESTGILPPGTVRKLPRRSSHQEGARTPGRPKLPPPTPSSLKRRVMQSSLLQRTGTGATSPNRKSPYRKPRSGTTPRTYRTLHEGGPSVPLDGTPTRATPYATKIGTVFKPRTTCQTAATVNSSLDETTTDSFDAGSPASTPFRFTSFPASLPRVHPKSEDRSLFHAGNHNTSSSSNHHQQQQHSNNANNHLNSHQHQNSSSSNPCDSVPPFAAPGTVRKRMTFSKTKECDDELASVVVRKTSTNKTAQLSLCQSRDDDGATHSSSLSSSCSGEHIHQQLPQSVPSFPPPVLEWKSPDMTNPRNLEQKFSEDSDVLEGRFGLSRHAKLFVGENTADDFENSDDDSPAGVEVPRTRLNFNVVLSPADEDHDALTSERITSLTYPEEDKIRKRFEKVPSTTFLGDSQHSFAGNSSHSSNINVPLSPARAALNSASTDFLSSSPEGVQHHFHMDGNQCSPIPGIPEEEDSSAFERGKMDLDMFPIPKQSTLQTTTPPRPGLTNADGTKLSFSQASSDSSTSSKLRRRPMPDMSAFEASSSVKSGQTSNQDKSSEESSGQPQSPRLLCPPTPVRTPAWAHNDKSGKPFVRANSLIVTKVLATCPIQVVDGHSSLENSLMDEDNDAMATIAQKRASLSFATVEEEEEQPDDFSRASSSESHSFIDESAEDRALITQAPSPSFSRLLQHGEMTTGTSAMPPKTPHIKLTAPKIHSNHDDEIGTVISFATCFENLGKLGSGAFADVYKVRSRMDGQLYAVKRNRRQFRGKRDRDLAMAEVRTMQKLQNVCADSAGLSVGDSNTEKARGSMTLYLLFFYRAWQEEGYFFCQTEICCRDTCRELLESLQTNWEEASRKYSRLSNHLPPDELGRYFGNEQRSGRLVPEGTIWKICHDVVAGLTHVHSQGIVHHDIKPSNIFFVRHNRFGAMCKIGDFGMAGEVGTAEDGQEGDTMYMAPELLSTSVKHPEADVFSLGLTIYELASAVSWELPLEGALWHQVRNGSHVPDLPPNRSQGLVKLIQAMIAFPMEKRPASSQLLQRTLLKEAGAKYDAFLHDYIEDVEEFDRAREERSAQAQLEADQVGLTPRHADGRELRTPTGQSSLPMAPALLPTEVDRNVK